MAAYDTTVPNNVLNIINVFISKRREDEGRYFVEGYKDLLVSLYDMLPNHEKEPAVQAWRFGVDLHKYLSEEDISTLLKNAPAVMRYCYSRRNEGSVRSDAVFMPEELIELFLETMDPKEGSSIFLPYAGDAEIVLCRPDCHYEGFEINDEQWALSKMVFDVCGIDAKIKHCPDSKDFVKDGKKYDFIFSFPPFLTGKEEREVIDELINCQNALAYKGAMYCCLPMSFCNAQSGWFDFRKSVLEHYKGYGVMNIALGSVLKPVTSVGICALAFSRDIQEAAVVLEDATGMEFRAKVNESGWRDMRLKVRSIVECLTQNDQRYVWVGTANELKHPLNLLPGRYLLERRLPSLKKGEKRIALGELVELCVLQRISSNDKDSAVNNTPVVGMKELFTNYINCGVQAKAEQTPSPVPARILDKNALLIGYINGKFKVGKTVGLNNGNRVILQQPIVAVNVISDLVSEEFLLRSILSDDVSMQTEVFATGAVAKKLSERDLLDIQIIVPSREEQDRLCREDARERLSAAERKIQVTFDRFRDDIHMKKHAIGQTVLSLNSWWRVLEIAHDEGLIEYNPDAVVDDEQGITVRDVFDNLYNGITQIQTQINRFDRGHRLVGSDLSVSGFVNNYIETHRKPEFQYEFIDGAAGGVIVFPQEALTMILDDIVSNACSHGFRNEVKTGNVVRIESSLEGTDCIVTVSNNGEPLNSAISKEDVFTYNRTGSTEKNHSGIGGYEVRNLMQQFDGEAEFISNPDEDFPVSYKLVFHNTKNISDDGE